MPHIPSPYENGNRDLRQSVGVKSTRTLKISSRPSSMASEQIQVWKSVRPWKFRPADLAQPGARIVDARDDRRERGQEVEATEQQRDSEHDDGAEVDTTKASNREHDPVLHDLAPTRTGSHGLRVHENCSSRPACWNSTSVRNILMPPPVEPVFAQ